MTDRLGLWGPRAAGAFAALLALAWLAPNHYSPWTAFHGEWLAALALVVGALPVFALTGPRIKVPGIVIAAGMLALVPVAQWCFGLIRLSGDAWLASLYLVGFCFSIQFGFLNRLAAGTRAVEPLAWGFLCAAIVSVGIAMLQWLSFSGLGILFVDLRPGSRPYGNLAQPNQLATLLTMGLAMAAYLHARRRFGTVTLGVVCLPLLFGLALTQSRTGWAQLGVLTGALLLARQRSTFNVNRSTILAAPVIFAAMAVCLGPLTEWLLLSTPTRTLVDQATAGHRPTHWLTVIDAMGRHPWTGWGWNQISVGVAQVAAEHAPSTEMIEHSHNLLLDLLAWNGVPLGVLVIAAAAVWLWRQGRDGANLERALLFAAIAMPLVHALFEFPLEYAYFLLPFGYLVGCLEATHPTIRDFAVPRTLLLAPAVAAAALLFVIGDEYLKIEENHRALRFESARIGPQGSPAPAPDVAILTQAREYLVFARTTATTGMSQTELQWMRTIADRYGYPPVLFRYALAAGLNNDPAEARRALLRICKQHTRIMCDEARDNWHAMQGGTYPVLAAIPFPDEREIEQSTWTRHYAGAH